MRKVNFYSIGEGRVPVRDFLDTLQPKQAKKILWVLKAVEDLPRVPEQYLKRLIGTDEIWEVRAEFGGDAFRLLGFWDEGNLIILTNAFAKKTQKTPEREIALAEARRRDYLDRRRRT